MLASHSLTFTHSLSLSYNFYRFSLSLPVDLSLTLDGSNKNPPPPPEGAGGGVAFFGAVSVGERTLVCLRIPLPMDGGGGGGGGGAPPPPGEIRQQAEMTPVTIATIRNNTSNHNNKQRLHR